MSAIRPEPDVSGHACGDWLTPMSTLPAASLQPALQAPGVPIANENRLVVADTLGTTIKLTSPASCRGPLAWANGLQPAGQVLSPIYRVGRGDVPRDLLAPGLLV